jgi:hypothetical protein
LKNAPEGMVEVPEITSAIPRASSGIMRTCLHKTASFTIEIPNKLQRQGGGH